MFMLKKFLTPFLLPLGLFILLLFVSGAWLVSRKEVKAGLLNIAIGAALWAFSILPVSDALMRGLDSDLRLPAKPEGDVIILLGGGMYSDVTDFSGVGAPSEDMLGRIVTAVRLQKKLSIPVIISTGKVYPWAHSEAPIAQRFLIDLGVPATRILLEEKSRDTMENARFSKELCEKMGFTKPILVTSSFHMKRAVMSFGKVGFRVTPYPSYLDKAKERKYVWLDYLPVDVKNSFTALREYLGLAFYKIAY